MRSMVLAAVASVLVFTGGCSDDDEKNTCADLRDRLTELETTSGTQSFEEVAEQVERTAERDALVAELSAEGCSGS
jgi:outer membrane lipoprotein-sorting protein